MRSVAKLKPDSRTVRVMVQGSTNQLTTVQAYSYQQSAAQLTIVVAPLIGGLLWNSAQIMPRLSRTLPFLVTYPALLPACFNATLAAGALFAVIKGVVEMGTMQQFRRYVG